VADGWKRGRGLVVMGVLDGLLMSRMVVCCLTWLMWNLGVVRVIGWLKAQVLERGPY
jgi:hypothetical protein